MKKLAVFFPGIGYTADKPLLYYSRKLAAELDYEVLSLSYGGFPKKPKGDPEKLRACFRLAAEQASEQLAEVRWKHYDEIVFVTKSIGTAVAAATFLDGGYAAFGRVTEGMEIAEQIAKDARPVDNNGTIPPEQQPVIESIVITD